MVKEQTSIPSVVSPGSSGNEHLCSSILSACSLATISIRTSLFSVVTPLLLLLLFFCWDFLLDFFEIREVTGALAAGDGWEVLTLVLAERFLVGNSTLWSSKRDPCDFKRKSRKSSPGPSPRPFRLVRRCFIEKYSKIIRWPLNLLI